jgi:hypothetical protein
VQHQASRIELALPERASAKQRRELGAIARYCVNRVERELGAPTLWFVRVGPIHGRYVCTVVVHDSGCAIETTRDEVDGALAIWDAVQEVERVLRDIRASRTRRKLVFPAA